MNWWSALATGVGLGLVHFGGLWLTIRLLSGRPGACGLFALSGAVRFGLLALVLYSLSGEAGVVLVIGLAGLLLARGALLLHVGGLRHG